MILNKDDFPITIQAFEITGDKEYFIAEQIVNSQQEVDLFSSRYAGKVIKVKTISPSEAPATSSKRPKTKSSATTIILVVLLILIILIAIGFYTGWIQRTTGINL